MSEAGAKATSSIRRMGVDVQRRIDEHVRQVDAALAKRDVPAAERRGIESALRQKILESLAARRGSTSAAPVTQPSDAPSQSSNDTAGSVDAVTMSPAPNETADIDAILAQLPAPEAFAATHAPQRVDRRRISLMAVAGAVWAPMFFLMLLFSSAQVEANPADAATPMWKSAAAYVLPPLGWAAPFATTVLGLIALGQINRASGRLYGLSLALFDALLFPLLLVDWLIYVMCRGLAYAASSAGAADLVLVLFTSILPTVLVVLVDYFLAARAWVAVRDTPPPATPAG